MLFDYYTLKIIWFGFIWILLVAFAVTGGTDLAVGALLPLIGKKDEERRLLINSIGPTWEGNQVWFVTAGGAIFAAWPLVYAAAFSGFYFALMLVLLALILRPPGIDFRSKLPSYAWRTTWDYCLCFSGTIPLLIFGVTVGNILQGIPFYLDTDLLSHYTGTFWELLNPFALLIGIVNLTMLIMHGAIFINLKTNSPLHERSCKTAKLSAIIFLISLTAAIYYVIYHLDGFSIKQIGDLNLSLNPLDKNVIKVTGALAQNFFNNQILFLVPTIIYITTLLAIYSLTKQRTYLALFLSSIVVVTSLITVAIALFPFILPSSTNPSHSLTIWDAVSSVKTLNIMFWMVVLFLPIILGYTIWAVRVLSGKVNTEDTLNNTNAY